MGKVAAEAMEVTPAVPLRCPVPVQFQPAAVGEAAELRERSEKLEP